MKEKNSFSGKLGFILAASGSAVGLGNLWRFPYLAAKYGGGTFLLVYLILAVTFGFALLTTEIAIGRKTGRSALSAFSSLHNHCGFIGVLASIVPIIIIPYYCVIGGWVVKYTITYLTGQGAAAVSDIYFSNFIAEPVQPIIWLTIFILATMVVILLGVNKG
ncbi:MAG: sodium-dependent transporter, partial [Lachnospiraceae bacterium]|nr:sodium-dependent transporter [Lachnospiraceae bacterium]